MKRILRPSRMRNKILKIFGLYLNKISWSRRQKRKSSKRFKNCAKILPRTVKICAKILQKFQQNILTYKSNPFKLTNFVFCFLTKMYFALLRFYRVFRSCCRR